MSNEEEVLTPYRVIKNLNEKIVGKEYPTQMMYNYVRNGLIKSKNNRITKKDAEIWIEKFITKNNLTRK